ncbi:MAG: Y-family DNA polymerase [Rikenellaceae bacterium]
MLGLCDCNNFFVSCERVFDPSLEGRAVVVMSSNDGCVIARSNEAKALGIKMGQPLYQIKELIARENVATLSTNLQLYGDMSQRVMQVLRENIPSVEIYSIDEAFLDFSGFDLATVEEFGRNLSRKVRRATGIPVSIGIAPTKTLAKIASKLCKQYPKLRGCCLMYRPEDIAKVLSKYPIEDVWGVGRKYAKELRKFGVSTAAQFVDSPPEWVRAKMSIVGLRTWRELGGEACLGFGYTTPERQSIMVSRSFAHEVDDLAILTESVVTFASNAAEKLRRQGSVAGQLQVFIFTNRHREDQPQHSEGRLAQFLTPTDSTLEIVAQATQLLRELFYRGFGYKKAGVILYDISSKQGVQSAMFDPLDRTKHTALMEVLDRINNDMGRSTLRVGSQGNSGVPTNSQHRSPLYTTSWSDILTIKV